LVGVIAFVFYKKRDIAYNYRALSPGDIDKELKRAEEKLADAQSQINALKNKDKIADMQNKLKQDQNNLDKMLKGM
jgi:ppGpp synthetase/RelA/SpoT-type nucleotidyltranferase